MSQNNPPRLPAWMLEHLKTRSSNEALDGDLLEEFRSGRSRLWYWYQVFAALAISWLKDIRHHRNLIVFAALWSIFAPGWTFLAMRVVGAKAAAWHIWQLEWPLSSFCSTILFFIPGLIFIWIGLALSYVVQIRNAHLRSIWRVLLLGVPVYIGISAAEAGMVLLFEVVGHSEVRHDVTLSISPKAPSIVLKAVGGGRDVVVTRDKHGVATVQSTTRVYVDPNSPWAPKPFQLDRKAANGSPSSPVDAITGTDAWSVIDRLPFFLSILLLLWTGGRAREQVKSAA